MSVCTFFGHRNCREEVKAKLKRVLEELIVKKGVNQFYVGTHGNFDFYVYQVLCELEKKYPEIRFTVVLAYMPCKRRQGDTFDWYRTTIYPKGIEKIPIRFALSFRNKWMIERSDSAATYILYSSGGAVCGACRKKRKDLYQFTGIDLKYFT